MNKWIILFTLGCLLLYACQTPRSSESESEPTRPPLSTPAPAEASDGQTTPPDLLTPGTSENELVRLSVENLSRRLHLDQNQIKVISVNTVVWKDASLGCPKPGIDYIRVETRGYSISLEADGQVYAYHTDNVKRVILCNAK